MARGGYQRMWFVCQEWTNSKAMLCMACAATITPAIPNAAPEPAWLLLAGC